MLRSMPRACFILLGLRIDSAFSLLVFCPISALVNGGVRIVSAHFAHRNAGCLLASYVWLSLL